VVAPKYEFNVASRPIAMLRHNNLSNPRFVVSFIVLRPIKKYDNVTILFDTPTFPQIAQNRPLLISWALFGSAAQLGDRNNWNPKFSRQTFESP
jgi:hypothetical protein